MRLSGISPLTLFLSLALQEMTSNNRILEIKSLLDTERLIKEEEVAKANQETSVVKAQMAQAARRAQDIHDALKSEISTRKSAYDKLRYESEDSIRGLEAELAQALKLVADKRAEYTTLGKEHESVFGQIAVLKADIVDRQSQHDALVEESEVGIAALNDTVEEMRLKNLIELGEQAADYQQKIHELAHVHLTTQNELQKAHHTRIANIIAGKDGALDKSYTAHEQEVSTLLAQYERRVGALETDLATQTKNFADTAAALEGAKKSHAEELQGAVHREKTTAIALTNARHDIQRLEDGYASVERRNALLIQESDSIKTSLQRQLSEKDTMSMDLKAEVIATRNKIPALVVAHEEATRKAQRFVLDLRERHQAEIEQLEGEQERISAELEDTTRSLWSESEEKKVVITKLEASYDDKRSTVKRMTKEKQKAMEEAEARLSTANHKVSITMSELSDTSLLLDECRMELEEQVSSMREAHRMAERSSERMVEQAQRSQEAAEQERDSANANVRSTKHKNDELRSDLRVILAQNQKAEKKNHALTGTVNELTHELSYQADAMETENTTKLLKMQAEKDASWDADEADWRRFR